MAAAGVGRGPVVFRRYPVALTEDAFQRGMGVRRGVDPGLQPLPHPLRPTQCQPGRDILEHEVGGADQRENWRLPGEPGADTRC